MKHTVRFIGFMTVALVVAAIVLRDTAKQRKDNNAPAPAPTPAPSAGALVPPYYADLRGVQIPRALPPERFSVPKTRESYRLAKKIPEALMQLPCYCWCERIDHKSLLDCFVDEHAEFCGICQDSAFWAHKRLKEQASIAIIRQEIIDHYSREYGRR